jgi:peptide/nickel transport system permease protein
MKFYARRIAFYVVTLWATISLNFLLPRLLPGDPADILLAKMQRAGGELNETTVRNIKALLGGDTSSMWEQYVAYWGRMLQGDLGVSVTKYPTPVTELIAAALPWTVILVGIATVISFVLGVGIGAWVGWRRGTWVDHLVQFTTVLQ